MNAHINWQDWQGIELAEVLVFFRHDKRCSMLCSFLPGSGTGNMIPGSDRIPGNRNTAASETKESSSHKSEVSAKLNQSQLSTFRRRHSSLI